MPLYTADALILRTYKLGEADRIVVFLTRDRGKKRGVAKGARRPRSRFVGALEPLTEVRVAYFEKERRELVGLNYAETVRSPLALTSGWDAPRGRRAGLRRAISPSCSTSGRRKPTPTSGCTGWARRCSMRCRPARRSSRWRGISSTGCCGCRGCIRKRRGTLSAAAMAFLAASRTRGARIDVGELPARRARTLKELRAACIAALIAMHLEKTLKSDRVLRDLRRHALRRSIDLRDVSGPHSQALGVLGLARLPAAAAARSRSRRRHLAPRDALPRARPEAVERGLRAAVAAARRRALRPEPEPAVQAPPVSRSSSSRRRTKCSRSISTASRRAASTRGSTTSGSKRTTGSRRRSARGASAGRCCSTAWRSRSSPISSRWAASTWRRSRARSPTGSSASRCSCSGSTTSSTSSGAAA